MNRNTRIAGIIAVSALLIALPPAFAQPPGGFGGGPVLFGPGNRGGSDRGGSDRGNTSSRSGTQQVSASSVVAVADERSNSVVVSAPDELLPMVEELIREIDSIIQRTAEVQVFPLKFASAEEMADLVENMFDDQNSRFSRFGGGSSRNATSIIETTAEFDERTNSVIVSADRDKMPLVAQMILTLDQDPARDQKVFIYDLKNANPESVQTILQEIIDQNQGRGSGSSSRAPTRGSTSPFTQRPVTSGTGGFGGTGNTGGTTFGAGGR